MCVFWFVVGFGVPRELHFAWFIALKCGHLYDTIFQGKVRFDVVSLPPLPLPYTPLGLVNHV